MKVPPASSVGLQPLRSPDYTADQVLPQGNPYAEAQSKLGEGLVAAGQTILRVDDILQDRLDRTRAKEADAKLADGFRNLMTSPEGYRNKTGRSAIDGREDIIKAIDAHRQQILGSLTPAQRDLLSDSDAARYQQVRNAIDGHYSQQLEAYEIGESEARANNLMLDSVEGYFAPKSPLQTLAQDPNNYTGVIPLFTGEPEEVQRQVKQRDPYEANRIAMRTELTDLAARRGLGPEATKALLAKADDNLHTGVVSRLIDQGKANEAKAYLADHKDQVTAGTMTKLTDGLDLAVTKETSTKVAKDLAAMPGGLASQFAKLQELYDKQTWGKDNEAVFKNALGQLTQHDKLVSEEVKRQQNLAWEQIEQYSQLHGGQLDAAHAQLVKDNGLQDKFNLFIDRGQQWVTTDVGHYALTVMTPKELRQKFGSEAVLRTNYRFELSTPDLDALTARWKSGGPDETMPKLDKKIVLADGLRDALGLPKTGKQAELDKNLFDRWSNSVDVEIQKLMRAKPGTAEEEHWNLAIEAAKKQGFYLNASGTGRPRLFVQAERGEMSGSVFIKRGNEMVEARLDDLFPPTGKTYRDTAVMKLEQEAMTEAPGKPKGYVMIDGRAVKHSSLTLADVVREATDIHEGFNKQQLDEQRRIGQQWLRDAYETEFRNTAGTRSVMQLEGPNTVETLPVAPKDLPSVKARARARVMDRESEWQGFHLTQQEIDAIIGPAPPAPPHRPTFAEMKRAGL